MNISTGGTKLSAYTASTQRFSVSTKKCIIFKKGHHLTITGKGPQASKLMQSP